MLTSASSSSRRAQEEIKRCDRRITRINVMSNHHKSIGLIVFQDLKQVGKYREKLTSSWRLPYSISLISAASAGTTDTRHKSVRLVHCSSLKPLDMSSEQQQKPQLKKRAVVSSFIFKYPEDGGKPLVALFRRSDKVSTYKSVFEQYLDKFPN